MKQRVEEKERRMVREEAGRERSGEAREIEREGWGKREGDRIHENSEGRRR